MKKMWTMAVLAGALALAGTAWAGGDWRTVAQLTTGGGAKEVSVSVESAEEVIIVCTEGQVNIQTLWVRNGGQKREIRVARTLAKGQDARFDLGGGSITGFRISDSGSGRYKIMVKYGHARHDRDRDRDWDRGRDYDRGRDRDWDDRHGRDYRHDYYDDRDRRGPPPPRYRDEDRGGWWSWFD